MRSSDIISEIIIY